MAVKKTWAVQFSKLPSDTFGKKLKRLRVVKAYCESQNTYKGSVKRTIPIGIISAQTWKIRFRNHTFKNTHNKYCLHFQDIA